MQQVYLDKIYEKIDFKDRPPVKGAYENCRFIQCDLSNTDLSHIQFIDCLFTDCNLSMANLNNTVFRDTTLRGCKMLGLRFDTCNKYGLSFRLEQCTLNHSSFYKTVIKAITFTQCKLEEADFSEADLTGSVFDQCDLNKALFEHTTLDKVNFLTAYNFSIDPELNRLKKARFSLSGLPGLLHKYKIEIGE